MASSGFVAPPWMRSQAPSVASASTIMIATSSLPSESVTTRPATVMSKTASLSCECLGKTTHWSPMSARRTPAMGPENGMPESMEEALAALMARLS